MAHSSAPDPAALLALATEVALEASALITARTPGRGEAVESKSSTVDLVTAVDRDVERLLSGRIRAARADDAIVGEEGTNHDGSSGVRWLIDPIDGTTNFLYGYPVYAVSICAELDGDGIAGVVHDVSRGETFAAGRGLGATRNGEPIRVSEKDELSSALIGTGFGYRADRRRGQAAVLGHVLPRVRDIRRSGSAALDMCAVACGRLDGYYEDGVQAWDTAAGELLVREAGGRVGRLTGATERGLVVAAGPALFEPLRALIQDALAHASSGQG